MGRLLEDPLDSRCTKMQACAAQYLCDLELTQTWAQSFEPLQAMTHEVRKRVDRRADLSERIRSLLVESFHPGGDGGRCHKKRIGRLL